MIGGPAHGHEWLLDGNGAWGQDLVYLKEWVERHSKARPLHLATVGWLDPQVLGIDYALPPVGPAYSSHHAPRDASPKLEDGRPQVPPNWQDVTSLADLGPRPGWYAVDVNFLHATDWAAIRPGWYFQKIAEHHINYEYFRLFEPCDRIAYSYLVYHITPE